MIKNLLLTTAILFSAQAFASSQIKAKYEVKSYFDLKKYNSSFVELGDTRAVKGSLDINLIHSDKKSERYQVKIGSSDLRQPELLKIKNGSFTVGSKRSNITYKNKYSSAEAYALLESSLKRDVFELIKSLDKNVTLKNTKINVTDLSFSCTDVNVRNKECVATGVVVVVAKKGAVDNISLLKNHLNDLKVEMVKSKEDYDIQGYREFLDKCEKLVKDVLDGNNGNKKLHSLVEIRRKIINERVDSYEYTAIRSASIAKFVDEILAII
ncbi:hypothetical protein [Bacteriovorax sp. Seq25_V]|uniref:hypothetical protein n=1 Tax=Bacteriovorax sp. Seq25_V TaxID=1201288 RepID=UPI0004298A99|nr:hypothetical protein [Bacteriovorax sp. Seq25_V]